MASPTTKPDQLAAPLDLLLTSATRPFASRMMPNATWARFGANLAKQPGAVAGRADSLVRELGSVATGRSHRAPARADKRFTDPAWQQNPLLHRIMQAYLAAAETADGLLADAQLDWRDNDKMRFVADNVVELLAPSKNPLISPQGWKALIDTGGLSAVRGARAFARDMLSKPRVPAMVEPDAFAVGETVATTKGAVVLQTSVLELIQYAPQTPKVRTIPLLMVPPVINKFYILDIAPGRSMIEYFVQQGQQVLTFSWRNPQARHRDWGFDTYGAAIVEALGAVQKITGADSAHGAESPVLFVGIRAGDPAPCAALRELLAVTDLPVVQTFQAAGVVSRELDDHFVGRVGLFRNQPGDILIGQADVVVTVGFDPVEYDPRLWNTDPTRPVVHIDEVPADIDHHYQPTVELRGDIAATLTELTHLLSGMRLSDAASAAVADQRAALRRIDEEARTHQDAGQALNPAAVVLKIRELVDDDATIACDVGSHYIYMARHFRAYQPRRLLFSDGQQTLGVALPWAMAAAMVRPGTQVVSVSGDGGFLFSAQELETATRLGLNFTHVIMRDNAYDMVAFQEVLKYGRTSGVELGDYDIVQYAGAFGAKGIRVSSMEAFADAFKRSLTESSVTIIDVPVDYSRNTELFARLHDGVVE